MSFCTHYPSRLFIRVGLAVVISMITGLTAVPSLAKTLTIATISLSPVDEIETFQPFADYLEGKLTTDGINEVKVIIAPDIPSLAKSLKNGEIDLYIDSSLSAMIANEMSGSDFLVRRWKKKRSKYRGVIFVSKDSTVQHVQDLKGKMIAFEEPFSTSGFMLPALTLRLEGLRLQLLTSVQQKPAANKIGYVLAYDNETQITWVERGLTAAAAMSEGAFEDYSKTAIIPLRIIHYTPYVPYHVVVARFGLDAKLTERITTVLKKIHESEEGAAMLMGFGRTAKFDDIPKDLMKNITALFPYIDLLMAK